MEKSNFPIYIVDAFAKSPFHGNPAAICLVPFNYDAGNDLKQKIAAEINLSETAFLKTVNEIDSFQSGKRFSLSWFTPSSEVRLCGHATLATAAVLFKECNNESQVLEFETLSGVLKAERVQNDRIQLNLPAYESNPVNEEYQKLVKAFTKTLPVEEAVLSVSKNVLIRLSDTVTRKEFEAIKTNDAELLSAASGIIGVILTVKASGEQCADEEGNRYDFLSRYFAPWYGVSEDPVCGTR
ncbi:Phenazine biosynthesis-like domain-containing protein 1 [Araneus ventricosus]|uniref:Phenazine biosynthesis-like domain-containing protein 1 n=1 Tax=Araneus ventricosus TaxID=182803 RepID=A0A4Y2ST98_ARAVE|nr:Phenazine biosynthesis-like domain-containing protein 1 [Araneus ventricosus]GBN91183.1 Phenazine biosynthesis-like domain-containing protein 1 [Araneus ventricosus]